MPVSIVTGATRDVYLKASNVSGSPGQYVSVNIDVTQNMTGFSHLQYRVGWDANSLELISVTPGLLPVVPIHFNNNPIMIVQNNPLGPAGLEQIYGTGTVLTLRFRILESAALRHSPITVQTINIGGAGATPVDIAPRTHAGFNGMATILTPPVEAPPPEADTPAVTPPPEADAPTEDLPTEEPPTEDIPTEEDTPTEEMPQDEPSDIGLLEIEPPPMPNGQIQPEGTYPANTTEPEEQYSQTETVIGDASTEINQSTEYIALPYEEDIDEYVEPATIEFTLTHFGNPVNDSISNYRIISRPSFGLQLLHGQIPAFTGGDGLFYTIWYRTNYVHGIIASGVPANRPFTLLPPWGLSDYDVITEIIIAFDAIPAGFGIGDAITYTFVVLDEEHVSHHWEVMFGEASNRNFIMAALLNNIDRISNTPNRYDAESWGHLQTVMNAVQAILNNPNATVEELEIAYVLLQQAIDGLNPTPSTIPLDSPSAFGRTTAVSMFGLFAVLIFVLVRLLKYKKRRMLRLPLPSC